jgi:hypothetical protein
LGGARVTWSWGAREKFSLTYEWCISLTTPAVAVVAFTVFSQKKNMVKHKIIIKNDNNKN